MKKLILPAILLALLLPVATGCEKTVDYTSRISEIKSDLFLADTEEFSLTLSCVSREYPYNADGIPAPRTDIVEIVLKDKQDEDKYEIYLSENRSVGGEMSYRSVKDDFYFSQGTEAFPEGQVALTVCFGEESRDVVLTSVKTETTLSPEEIVDLSVKSEQKYCDSLTQNGEFGGELYVRLLKRDKNYYYVGIISKDGKVLSLLLDAESGSVLAKREHEKIG